MAFTTRDVIAPGDAAAEQMRYSWMLSHSVQKWTRAADTRELCHVLV